MNCLRPVASASVSLCVILEVELLDVRAALITVVACGRDRNFVSLFSDKHDAVVPEGNSKSGFIFFCPGRESCFNQHLLKTLSPDSIIVCFFASALIPEENLLLKLEVSQYSQFFQMLCDG